MGALCESCGEPVEIGTPGCAECERRARGVSRDAAGERSAPAMDVAPGAREDLAFPRLAAPEQAAQTGTSTPPSRRLLYPGLAVLGVLGVLGLGASLLAGPRIAPDRPGPGTTAASTSEPSTTSAVDSPAVPTEPAPPSEVLPSTPRDAATASTLAERTTAPTPTTPSEARRWLDARVRADQPHVALLLDRWIPIVSSKRPGVVDPADSLYPGQRYDAVMVTANFEYWRERYPDALLARSSDYVSHHPGFWITLVPRPRRTADAVIAWCQREGLSPNDCYATRVSHTRRQGDGTAKTWG